MLSRRSVSIKWVLPAMASAFVAAIIGASLYTEIELARIRQIETARLDARQTVANLAMAAEHLVGGDVTLIESLIAKAYSDQRVKAVLVLDNANTVLYAHRTDLVGDTFEIHGLLPGKAGRLFSRTPQEIPGESPMEFRVWQQFSLHNGGARVGAAAARGIVYAHYDLRESWRNEAIASLRARIPEFFGIVMLFFLGVLALRRGVTKPLLRLTEAARRIAEGDMKARAQVNYAIGEVDYLIERFNAMAEAIEQSHHALVLSRSRLDTTLDCIGDALITTDTEGRITRMNPVAEHLTGWEESEALGREIAEVFVVENAYTKVAAEIPVHRVLRDKVTVSLANHTMLRSRDGRTYHIADSAAPIRNEAGEIEGVVMVFYDVTQQYNMRISLMESEQRFRTLANSGAALIWTGDSGGRRDWFNEQWLRFTGRSLEQEQGTGWLASVHPDDRERVHHACVAAYAKREAFSMEYRLQHVSGGYRWIIDHGTPRFEGGGFVGHIGYCMDIDEQKRVQEEMQHAAHHDTLTGLPNRVLYMDRLTQALAVARRHAVYGAVIFIDVDQFKQINDVHGHEVGDALIRALAERMRNSLRESDTVARFGGDEFLVLLPEIADNAQDATRAARAVAEKLLEAISRRCAIGDHDFTVGASLGVTIFPKDDESPEDLIREADMAMYRAKDRGRNQVAIYEPEFQTVITQRYALERALRSAIASDEIDVCLHSQVDAQGRMKGAEVLLRWTCPVHGVVPPATFISLAEDTGLIFQLGSLALRKGCEVIREIMAQGRRLSISVNVSPRQFRDPDFARKLRQILDETGADASLLVLEITENLLVEQPQETAERMREMARMGVRFSIDDFGTGYSSLAYLKRLPLAELKIDKSFVQDAPFDPNDAVLVETLISMARHLGLDVVAEGVETSAQRDFLIDKGCRLFQGYYWYRPMAVEEWLSVALGPEPAAKGR